MQSKKPPTSSKSRLFPFSHSTDHSLLSRDQNTDPNIRVNPSEKKRKIGSETQQLQPKPLPPTTTQLLSSVPVRTTRVNTGHVALATTTTSTTNSRTVNNRLTVTPHTSNKLIKEQIPKKPVITNRLSNYTYTRKTTTT